MRILFINRMLSLVRGGGETFDLEIAKQLSKSGCDIDFLSSRPLTRGALLPVPKDLFETPVQSHLLASPFLGWFPWDRVKGGWRIRSMEYRLFERKVVKWVMRHGHQYDVIQICELPYVVTELKRQGCKTPLVMRLTGPNYDDFGGAVRRADGIIASGTSIATVMKRERPDAVNVPNCVDSGRFKSQESDFRRIHRIGKDELVMLYVARLQGFKDHETLVRSLAEVVKERATVRLVLAGSGHTRKDVELLIDELGLRDHVLILGETEYDQLPKVCAAADVAVISSVYESFCFAALEAMATALPVVTTDNGWVPQLLGRGAMPEEAFLPGYEEPDDEVTELAGGLVVPKGNPGRMAEAVLQLADDVEMREKMGQRNRDEVVQKYNWGKSASILEKLYEEILTTKNAEVRENGDEYSNSNYGKCDERGKKQDG
ncbi:MAG: glycosyltransferase family 1 protein [Spartobacteria bacterium]|nr:glycosyltransferase family 1 protein [Spartobacteria bacterium]